MRDTKPVYIVCSNILYSSLHFKFGNYRHPAIVCDDRSALTRNCVAYRESFRLYETIKRRLRATIPSLKCLSYSEVLSPLIKPDTKEFCIVVACYVGSRLRINRQALKLPFSGLHRDRKSFFQLLKGFSRSSFQDRADLWLLQNRLSFPTEYFRGPNVKDEVSFQRLSSTFLLVRPKKCAAHLFKSGCVRKPTLRWRMSIIVGAPSIFFIAAAAHLLFPFKKPCFFYVWQKNYCRQKSLFAVSPPMLYFAFMLSIFQKLVSAKSLSLKQFCWARSESSSNALI